MVDGGWGKRFCVPHTNIAPDGTGPRVDRPRPAGQHLWGGLRSCGDVSFVLRAAALPDPPARAADLDDAAAVVGSDDLVAHSLGLHDPSVGLNEPQQKILEAVAQVWPLSRCCQWGQPPSCAQRRRPGSPLTAQACCGRAVRAAD